MKIIIHKNFDKHFRKRIFPYHKLISQYKFRTTLFLKNSQNSLLNDHPLKGTKIDKRAFSITGDIRVIYEQIDENTVLFLDIGTHNQVY